MTLNKIGWFYYVYQVVFSSIYLLCLFVSKMNNLREETGCLAEAWALCAYLVDKPTPRYPILFSDVLYLYIFIVNLTLVFTTQQWLKGHICSHSDKV